MKSFVEVNIKVITYIAGFAEAATILTTWFLCSYIEGQCPKLPHLPTISDTWVPAPGNYLSRWVTAAVCIVMGVAQWVIYAINTGKTGYAPHITDNFLAVGISVVGYLSIVCLSWVAAICDNTNADSCRGDGTIHSIIAVSFFIGYNVMMAVSSFSKPGALSTHHHLCTLLSILSKARFFVPGTFFKKIANWTGVDDQTPLAIVEWSDVLLIIVWTVGYLRLRAPFAKCAMASLETTPTSGKETKLLATASSTSSTISNDATTIAFFSLRFLSTIVVTWFFTCLFVCLGFMVQQGRIPPGHVPYISDMWVYPPGDWISRNMVVGGAFCGIVVQILMYFANQSSSGPAVANGAQQTILAVVALLGLSVVGVVNEDENDMIHSTAAAVWFVGYDAYMVWTATARIRASAWQLPALALVLGSLASKARFCGDRMSLGGDSNVPEILEWLDAFCIVGYFIYDAWYHRDVAETIGVLVYQPSSGVSRSARAKKEGRAKYAIDYC